MCVFQVVSFQLYQWWWGCPCEEEGSHGEKRLIDLWGDQLDQCLGVGCWGIYFNNWDYWGEHDWGCKDWCGHCWGFPYCRGCWFWETGSACLLIVGTMRLKFASLPPYLYIFMHWYNCMFIIKGRVNGKWSLGWSPSVPLHDPLLRVFFPLFFCPKRLFTFLFIRHVS